MEKGIEVCRAGPAPQCHFRCLLASPRSHGNWLVRHVMNQRPMTEFTTTCKPTERGVLWPRNGLQRIRGNQRTSVWSSCALWDCTHGTRCILCTLAGVMGEWVNVMHNLCNAPWRKTLYKCTIYPLFVCHHYTRKYELGKCKWLIRLIYLLDYKIKCVFHID